jgi:hypothetical protein
VRNWKRRNCFPGVPGASKSFIAGVTVRSPTGRIIRRLARKSKHVSKIMLLCSLLCSQYHQRPLSGQLAVQWSALTRKSMLTILTLPVVSRKSRRLPRTFPTLHLSLQSYVHLITILYLALGYYYMRRSWMVLHQCCWAFFNPPKPICNASKQLCYWSSRQQPRPRIDSFSRS